MNRLFFICLLIVSSNIYAQELWQTGTQGIYYSSGKVGIGVSPVNGKLTVNDPGGSQIRIENDSPGGEPSIRLRARSADNSKWLHADIGIFSTSNSSEVGFLGFKVPYNNSYGAGYKMIINSSGKVGIGTTSPSETLEIAHIPQNSRVVATNTVVVGSSLGKLLLPRTFLWQVDLGSIVVQ